MIEFVDPPGVAPPLGNYSHLAIVAAGSDLLFIAGQVGMKPNGTVPADINEQYRQALENICSILASEECGPADLVKLNTFLVAPLELNKVREMRQAILGEARPPSTLVYVPQLAAPEFLVEIEAVAARQVSGKPR